MSDVARIFAPMFVWLALFSGVYAVHGLGCGLGWDAVALGAGTFQGAALVVAAAGAVLVQAGTLYLIAGPLRSPAAFARRLSLTVAVVGLVAMVWTLIPVAVTSYCVP
jgi:hypothetical protein